MRLRGVVALAFAISVLSACSGGGGGGGGGTAAPTPGGNPSPAAAPTITAQPQSVTLDDGQAASFSVAASGSGPIAFQWQRDGQPIAGATSTSFSIPATTIADNGAKFSVVATNSAGSVRSSVATLNVRALAPTITGQSQTTSVLVGGSATFTVAATGTAPLQFQWRRNGVSIPGATSASFLLSSATLADSGAIFDVVVSNAGGTVTSVGTVLTVAPVTVAPSILVQPQDATVLSGGAATFTVTADGTAPVSFQWRRNGTEIAGANNATLNLSSVALAEDGSVFTVVVTNSAGTATSAAATLHVRAAAGIALLAGGLGGAGNIDGLGAGARFNGPTGVAGDAAGNIYVTDSQNHTVRKITPAGVVTTYAGRAGLPGSTDGAASEAQFNSPGSIASCGDNLFIVDASNFTIRKIVTSTGQVSTLAGAVGQQGYVDATGSAARFSEVHGIACDTLGNMYVGDNDGVAHITVRKITPQGDVATFAGGPRASALNGTGIAARFISITSMAADSAGNLYVGDFRCIRKVTTPAAEVTTFVSGDSQCAAAVGGIVASLGSVLGLALDASGNLYVADKPEFTGGVVRKITPAPQLTTIAGRTDQPWSGSADGTGTAAQFSTLSGLAVDASGDVIGADAGNNTIRRITSTGTVTTFAGTAARVPDLIDGIGIEARFRRVGGIASDATGFLYVVDDLPFDARIRRVSPNGQTATLAGFSSGSLLGPAGLVLEGSNTIYVVQDCFVLKITPSGTRTAGFWQGQGACGPAGIARAASGDLFIADTVNNVIRRVTPAGDVSTVAGGPAGFADATGADARFNTPEGIAVDAAGVLYVADTQNHVIRKITLPLGEVSTLAGTPGQRGFVDANTNAAKFDSPHSLAVDTSGNLYVADSGNHAIRRISASGEVSTIAGRPGAIGVGTGPLPGALSNPRGITLVFQGTGATVLGVTDAGENVVLTITVP
jgi:sugar lactone lactonase YvrE